MARPRGFDRDAVLERAAAEFWEKGYEAASIQDLVTATGLQRGSLYAAFGSKQGIFLAALEHYGERVVSQLLQVLGGADSPLDGVRACFDTLIDQMTASGPWRGCLLTNAAVERGLRDPATRARVQRWLGRLEDGFRAALAQAQEAGELPAAADPAPLAQFLLTVFQGLLVVGRIDPRRERLEAVVATAVAALAPARSGVD